MKDNRRIWEVKVQGCQSALSRLRHLSSHILSPFQCMQAKVGPSAWWCDFHSHIIGNKVPRGSWSRRDHLPYQIKMVHCVMAGGQTTWNENSPPLFSMAKKPIGMKNQLGSLMLSPREG